VVGGKRAGDAGGVKRGLRRKGQGCVEDDDYKG